MDSGLVLVRQRHKRDCGIAALASLLHLPYGDVAAKTREVIPNYHLGLSIPEVVEIAAHLNVILKRVPARKTGALDGTGILGVTMPKSATKGGHWVCITKGVIVDPDDGSVSGVDAYCKKHHAKPGTLLVIEA